MLLRSFKFAVITPVWDSPNWSGLVWYGTAKHAGGTRKRNKPKKGQARNTKCAEAMYCVARLISSMRDIGDQIRLGQTTLGYIRPG